MIDLVLSSPKWILSLLSTIQSHMFAKSSFNYFSISWIFLLWKTRHVSSTYKNRLHLTALGISLTYIKNNKGPRTDPCGTPHDMLETSEKEFCLNRKLKVSPNATVTKWMSHLYNGFSGIDVEPWNLPYKHNLENVIIKRIKFVLISWY